MHQSVERETLEGPPSGVLLGDLGAGAVGIQGSKEESQNDFAGVYESIYLEFWGVPWQSSG